MPLPCPRQTVESWLGFSGLWQNCCLQSWNRFWAICEDGVDLGRHYIFSSHFEDLCLYTDIHIRFRASRCFWKTSNWREPVDFPSSCDSVPAFKAMVAVRSTRERPQKDIEAFRTSEILAEVLLLAFRECIRECRRECIKCENEKFNTYD